MPDASPDPHRLAVLWNAAFWYGADLTRKRYGLDLNTLHSKFGHDTFMRRMIDTRRRHCKQAFATNVGKHFSPWLELCSLPAISPDETERL